MVYSLVYQTLNVNENKGDQGMHHSNGYTPDVGPQSPNAAEWEGDHLISDNTNCGVGEGEGGNLSHPRCQSSEDSEGVSDDDVSDSNSDTVIESCVGPIIADDPQISIVETYKTGRQRISFRNKRDILTKTRPERNCAKRKCFCCTDVIDNNIEKEKGGASDCKKQKLENLPPTMIYPVIPKGKIAGDLWVETRPLYVNCTIQLKYSDKCHILGGEPLTANIINCAFLKVLNEQVSFNGGSSIVHYNLPATRTNSRTSTYERAKGEFLQIIKLNESNYIAVTDIYPGAIRNPAKLQNIECESRNTSLSTTQIGINLTERRHRS